VASLRQHHRILLRRDGLYELGMTAAQGRLRDVGDVSGEVAVVVVDVDHIDTVVIAGPADQRAQR
jgi:hypothetical protein